MQVSFWLYFRLFISLIVPHQQYRFQEFQIIIHFIWSYQLNDVGVLLAVLSTSANHQRKFMKILLCDWVQPMVSYRAPRSTGIHIFAWMIKNLRIWKIIKIMSVKVLCLVVFHTYWIKHHLPIPVRKPVAILDDYNDLRPFGRVGWLQPFTEDHFYE